MKQRVYTLIPLLVLTGPLAMSFDAKVNFIHYIIPVLIATVAVAALYIIWDIIVVRKGHWEFNTIFVGKARIGGLPVGEILFFLCIPYACLFLFEVGRAYIGSFVVFVWPVWISWVFAGIALFFSILNRRRGYTMVALFSVACFFSMQAIMFPSLPGSIDFLFFCGTSFVAFLLVDGIYTSLPTIFYNPNAVWGLRIGSIPLEDFFYNLSYLGLSLLVYLAVRQGIAL